MNLKLIRGFSEIESHELVFVLSNSYFLLSVIYINTPFFYLYKVTTLHPSKTITYAHRDASMGAE